MADQDGTNECRVTDISAASAQQREIEEGKRWNQQMRLKACDEVIEDAIDMLGFLALDREVGSTLVSRAVAVQSDAIVERLREAQKHLRRGAQ